MEKKDKFYDLADALDYIWVYSHFLQQELYACEEAARNGHYFLSVLTQISLLEDTIKTAVDNFEDNFNKVAELAYNKGYLSEKEYCFVSSAENSLRKFRNCIAHNNLMARCLQFSMDPLLYPLTEEETYQHFYDKYAEIIVNIILKVISQNETYKICVDRQLKNNGFKILTFSIPELLEQKGYPSNYCDKVDLPEADIIRLIDNSSDLNMVMAVLKSNLFESNNVNSKDELKDSEQNK